MNLPLRAYLCVIALLLSGSAEALAGGAWFVQPAGVCEANGDGRSSECATSTGGHGAFAGFPAINWAGVVAGDTLYVCGSHHEQLSVLASGSPSARIILSGACPGNQGSIVTAGGSALDSAMLLVNRDHVEIRDFAMLIGNRSAVLLYASNHMMDDITITRNVIDNRTAASSTNVCNGIGLDGPFGHSHVDITYNTILGTSPSCGGTSNSDGINAIRLKSGRIAWNDISGSEGGIDVDGTMEGVTIYGNWSHSNRVDGMKAFGGHACPIGPLVVSQNRFINNGNWGAIWQNQRNGVFADNTIIQFRDIPQSGGPPYGGLQTEDPVLFDGSLCPGSGNTYLGNIITANWQYGVVTHYSTTKEAFESGNTWQGNLIYQRGAQLPLIWFGTPLSPTSQVTEGTYAAWQSAHRGDVHLAPSFRDASACVSQASVAACDASDFRLAPSSTFAHDGSWWTTDCVGVNGVVCVPPVRANRYPSATLGGTTYTFTGTITGPLP